MAPAGEEEKIRLNQTNKKVSLLLDRQDKETFIFLINATIRFSSHYILLQLLLHYQGVLYIAL